MDIVILKFGKNVPTDFQFTREQDVKSWEYIWTLDKE